MAEMEDKMQEAVDETVALAQAVVLAAETLGKVRSEARLLEGTIAEELDRTANSLDALETASTEAETSVREKVQGVKESLDALQARSKEVAKQGAVLREGVFAELSRVNSERADVSTAVQSRAQNLGADLDALSTRLGTVESHLSTQIEAVATKLATVGRVLATFQEKDLPGAHAECEAKAARFREVLEGFAQQTADSASDLDERLNSWFESVLGAAVEERLTGLAESFAREFAEEAVARLTGACAPLADSLEALSSLAEQHEGYSAEWASEVARRSTELTALLVSIRDVGRDVDTVGVEGGN